MAVFQSVLRCGTVLKVRVCRLGGLELAAWLPCGSHKFILCSPETGTVTVCPDTASKIFLIFR